MSAVLEVRDLRVDFETEEGVLHVLNGVSFDLRSGEVLGLVGETGCGKTVTALTVLGLLPPNARVVGGEVLFEGRDLLAMPERERGRVRGRRIAMIFQDPATSLNPTFPAGEQVARVLMAREGLEKRAARERTRELFRLVALPDPEGVARSYPHELSGGMQQRVTIAMALSLGPHVLIADEPTTAVDVATQAQILELILDLRRRLGLSVLLITHNLAVVWEVATRTAVMYAGDVAEVAPTEALFRNPLHPYTQGLLRALPTREARGRDLAPVAGSVPFLLDPPPGCRFHPRCGYAMPKCREAKPPLYEVEADHVAACVLYEEGG